MSIIHDLQHSIHQILRHHRLGSYATQAARRDVLMLFARDLVSLGYKLRHIKGLERKHIVAVINHWQAQGKASGTLKNRTSHLRFLTDILGRKDVVPNNTELHIPNRCYIPIKNKALENINLERVRDPYIALSLRLQKAFGLRREEALKIKPWLADKGNQLFLQGSWCKGGRERYVPILTEEQRILLDEAKNFVSNPDASLIPIDRTYKQQRDVYKTEAQFLGLNKLHGLRHAYAQHRYQTITGWLSPLAGGPSRKALTPAQRTLDLYARNIITEELGHSRPQILKIYCGK